MRAEEADRDDAIPAITSHSGVAAVSATPAISSTIGIQKTRRRPTRPASDPNHAELDRPEHVEQEHAADRRLAEAIGRGAAAGSPHNYRW